MGLDLKELVELALLDAVADGPATLQKLLGAGAPWHEISTRGDVRDTMAQSMHRMLADQELTVIEADGGTQLVGSEAAMVLQRAAEHPEMLVQTEIMITDSGRLHYKRLAHRYYNG